MKSLYEIYEGIYAKKELWDYYNHSRNSSDLELSLQELSSHPFLSETFSEKFIKDYFLRGGKSIVTEDAERLTALRKMHTVSTFFLGLYLCDFLNVPKKVFKPDFRYLWFMSCLYHDFGYMYEREILLVPEPTHDVFDVIKIPKDLRDCYDENTIKKYSIYRNGKDHGIEGGRRLYDLLIKNFIEAQNRCPNLKNGQKPNSFVIDGLRFRETDKTYYAQVALYVMLHNIFFCNDPGSEQLYRQYDLEYLIGKKLFYKRSSSLLFLLIFADTIEPVKFLERIKSERENLDNYEKILEHIYLDTHQDRLDISLDQNDLMKINYPVDKWIKNLEGMPDWINMSVTRKKQKITLHVNTSY